MNNDVKEKVSILTPCYNMEKYLPDYFDSVLLQDYGNIELIIVDDGSTDRSKTIIQEYSEKLHSKNILFKYIYQQNAGLGAAIACGMKYITGDYLIWPDADDILLESSISTRVRFLNAHKEYGYVRCNAVTFAEDNKKKIIGYITKKRNNKKEYLFKDFVYFRTYWCPGCYMIRVSALKKVNPDFYIYPSRGGQDIQLLLPLAYKERCAYLDVPLYGYRIRKGSHSRIAGSSVERQILQIDTFEDIMTNTLLHMEREVHDIIPYMNENFIRLRFDAAFSHKDNILKRKYYEQLKEKKLLTITERIMIMTSPNRFINIVVRICKKITRRT